MSYIMDNIRIKEGLNYIEVWHKDHENVRYDHQAKSPMFTICTRPYEQKASRTTVALRQRWIIAAINAAKGMSIEELEKIGIEKG